MLQRIEELAELSVARGCGFVMIAIATSMVGLSFDPHQCLNTGGVLSLLTALLLAFRAQRAYAKPYQTTELWLLLAPADRPPQPIAQRLISRALRDAYRRFAIYFARGAAGLLTLNLAISFFL